MSFGEDVAKLIQDSNNPVISCADHWERVPLGAVATILNGYPWDSRYFSNDQGISLIRIRDVTSGFTETRYNGHIVPGYEIKSGDLLVGMDGDFNIRRWTSNPGLLNQRVCKITSDEEIYLSRFLEYVLPGYLTLINQHTSSVTVKHLSSKTLAQIPLPLPPFAEQHRIVAKLDTLTGCLARVREELDRVQHLIYRFRQQCAKSQIKNALAASGSVDAGKIFTWSSGKFLPKSKQRSGPVPVFGGNGIAGYHDEANSREPSLVVGRVGAQCGNVHLTGSLAWITDNAIFAKKVAPEVDLLFALHLFRSADLIQKAAGTGQPYVNQEALNSVQYPALSRAEQHRIAAEIDGSLARGGRLEAEVTHAAALLDHLEASILAKAFRGELVPQDPADEPASVLLDRIRAQRNEAPPSKRGRRKAITAAA